MWIYHWVWWYRSSYHEKALVAGSRKIFSVCDTELCHTDGVTVSCGCLGKAAAGAWGSLAGSCCPYPGQTPGSRWVCRQCRQYRQRTPPSQPIQGSHLTGRIREMNCHPVRQVCILQLPLQGSNLGEKSFLWEKEQKFCVKSLKSRTPQLGTLYAFKVFPDQSCFSVLPVLFP